MTDNTNSNNNDDAEKMRLAFEQFMLSGGKNNKNNKNSSNNNSQTNRTNDEASTPQSTSNKSKKKKKKKRQSTSSSSSATPTKAVPTPKTKQQSLQSPLSSQQSTTTPNPKIKKRYYQLLRSYTDKIKHTWVDIDEQLLSVLQNVGSIRGRLPYEWKVFSQVSESLTLYHREEGEEQVDGWFESPEQEEEIDDDNDNEGGDWKSHGYQEHPKISSSQYLQINDLQLALSHDLEQHEKMLIGLRSLMSNLAECHDALGRIVDSLWQFHFEVEEGNEYAPDEILEHIVTCVTESYQMLSMELYQKQNLIALVIESTKDEIFGMNDELLLGKGPHSQKLVRECCKSWKRSSGDEELLLNVMKLGES